MGGCQLMDHLTVMMREIEWCIGVVPADCDVRKVDFNLKDHAWIRCGCEAASYMTISLTSIFLLSRTY